MDPVVSRTTGTLKASRLMQEVSDMHPYSEEHVRFLAESLPEIVWTALPDGTVDYMNKRWFAYTGLTEQETYGEMKTVVHPEDFAEYKSRWADSIHTGEPYEMAYRFRRAGDGVYRWHIGRALPVRNAGGRIIKWFGTCVDIHGQKEAEEQIRRMNEELESTVAERTKHLRKEIRQRRRAEERYRAHLHLLHNMIDLFPMAAVVMDSRGSLLHANERFYGLFTLTRDTPVFTRQFGMSTIISRRFPVPDSERLMRRIMESGEPFREEIAAGDGRIFSFEYIPTTEGFTESGYLLLVRDISQEKKIDRAKSEFMALASHQLRTPLASVRWALGRLSRMLSGKIEAPERQLLERAQTGAMMMAQTVTTMLSISRIEAGLHTVNTSEMKLPEFFGELRGEFAASVAAGGLTFTASCPEGLSVKTDPAMLREIVENLLTNAVKYTPSGGSVSLTAEKIADEILIRVRDTGCGIPSHQHKHIFGKFFRGENILKINTQGTGLGLYLVKQLVHSIGAEIRFTSAEGKGTEFTLSLPSA